MRISKRDLLGITQGEVGVVQKRFFTEKVRLFQTIAIPSQKSIRIVHFIQHRKCRVSIVWEFEGVRS